MGIYPETQFKIEGKTVTRTVSTPGLERVYIYELVSETEKRDDCFCCSCDESDFGYPYIDGACRNHGYYAKRPCETHNMPGYPWEDTNEMPESVQAYRGERGIT